jgi:hypothetical protein
VTEDLREVLRRNLHPEYNTVPLADAVTAVDGLLRERDQLRRQLAELNQAITWETSCLNCSSLLTRSYADYCRTDVLVEAVQAIASQLSQAGVHDAAEQLGAAIDAYREAADGAHFYLSTACQHGLHGQCRVTCKYGPDEVCACPVCRHEPPVLDKATPLPAQATASRTTPDKAVTSGGAADIAGEP